MSGARGTCQVCAGDYALVPSTGMVRAHGTGGRHASSTGRCPGSGHLPRLAVPAEPTVFVDQIIAVQVDCGCDDYSAWHPLPTTLYAFRRCGTCGHTPMQYVYRMQLDNPPHAVAVVEDNLWAQLEAEGDWHLVGPAQWQCPHSLPILYAWGIVWTLCSGCGV